ncbi:Epoxyqueuosine reductase [Hyella patelloides LEGE 07179]|uniref:Epoxyqueuosine reductase n=1 Tax=Hyella patelloides LEGE 07179 TaxID=945734 RepID=A0A563VQP5_9CYAN|nr:tRNA epoxyqueuosine(34) reductase QueG [Hyella patelloides]VEP13695.1 Epoxyqueuosine reductase [Hyella patelloides LEGE 07179]
MLRSKQIKTQAQAIGFHKVGIAKVDRSENHNQAVQHLQSWLALGYHADMAWMANPQRQDVRSLMPEARSLICVALNYYTPHQHSEHPEDGKISRYGWGRDYHKVMGQKLKALSSWLQEQQSDIRTRYYVDTAPIQDKVWAQQAGIGWIAKNGNVITTEYGSWVFLGEILTNLDLEPDRPHSQHCGTCTRCLDACPTQAIAKPFVVDANRCIAYHTIENRSSELPPEIAGKLSGWVAGCDICQDVCPWNQRFAQETNIADFQPYPPNIRPKLQYLAQIEETAWDRQFRASALRRIKPKMLRRNARANLIARENSTDEKGIS